MRITSSSIDISAQHSAVEQHELSERLQSWVGVSRPPESARRTDAVTISPEGFAAMQNAVPVSATVQSKDYYANRVDNDSDPRFRFIRMLVEMLTGERINVLSASDIGNGADSAANAAANAELADAAAAAQGGAASQNGTPPAGFGIEFDHHEVHREFENASLQASGKVRTADGREIDFTYSLDMSRSFRSSTDVSIRAGDALRKDPLVINFGGSASILQNQRFGFDIDSDGKQEQLAMFAGDSGYLALDLNQNGKIDDGSELFGAASGDGFADLAKFDDDANGWIDEDDAVFGKLRIWSPDADGKGSLRELSEREVGALYLGKADLPFELRGEGNADLGAIRSAGIYLTESGGMGSLQQIDLSV